MSQDRSVQEQIQAVTKELSEMLIAKNAAYGNSALDPLRVFSKADAVEQINVRIDDKLSRIARGSAAGEDAEWDLLGYLVLKRVAMRMNAGGQARESDERCPDPTGSAARTTDNATKGN